MTQDEHELLKDLEHEDRKWTLRESLVTSLSMFVVLLLAILAIYNYTTGLDSVSRISCEGGDVTLILERADGAIERIECPVRTPRTPRGVDSWPSISLRGSS